MIVFEDVTKDYKGGNHALKHVNLRIRKGDFATPAQASPPLSS